MTPYPLSAQRIKQHILAADFDATRLAESNPGLSKVRRADAHALRSMLRG